MRLRMQMMLVLESNLSAGIAKVGGGEMNACVVYINLDVSDGL